MYWFDRQSLRAQSNRTAFSDEESFIIQAVSGWEKSLRRICALALSHCSASFMLLFVLSCCARFGVAGASPSQLTAFTIAHSLRLPLMTLGSCELPGPPVECDHRSHIMLGCRRDPECTTWKPIVTTRLPWLVASASSCFHGFGCGALAEVDLPQHHPPSRCCFHCRSGGGSACLRGRGLVVDPVYCFFYARVRSYW